uniref:Probable molybdopterin-synthase adenylyltransferase n=1 Tax=Renouxia sp. TaxID=2485823 RepID=A0A3G3MH76_9FLOR|nr:molybdopterin biosynthesis protein [Renouxia sp.]
MLNPRVNTYNLFEEEYERYSRHLILNKIGPSGQKRIKASRILFVGAGGLSSSALLYLIASGVGTIGIIDNDQVETSNLQRQIIYRENNIKEHKVTAAKNNLKELNSSCKIEIYQKRLNKTNAFNIIRHYDIIIDSTDNISSRHTISYSCYQLHKIHVYGAVHQFEGQISVFNYQGGPSYYNLYSHMGNSRLIECNQRGVFGILPGIIGLLQATEAIKIITGNGNVLNGHLLKYNALNMSFQKIKIKPQKIRNTTVARIDTKIHNSNQNNHISMTQLYFMKNEDLTIIDIREQTEFMIKHIKNSINIPLKKIKQLETIKYLQKYFTRQIIIIYCNNEYLSSIASKILNTHKIEHYILSGGIETSQNE